MIRFSKKVLVLASFTFVLSAAAAFAGDFTCRLTLANSGGSRAATKGVIKLHGMIGERVTGNDEGTRFRYKVEVVDGNAMSCRGNRRQALVSLARGNEHSALVTAGTCFEPNRDFLITSAADDHWIYFQCYANDQR